MTNLTLHTLDFPTLQLHRHAIGFDRLFDELNRTFANSRADNYPPHNIAQLDDTHFVVEVAVAGFKESEVDVELKDNVLIVKGEKPKDEDVPTIKYLHKGLSARNFTRTFTLADNVEVRAATIENGVLAIALELVLPEEEKPTKIAITYKK
jgi:molecular chaperone IbpA